MDETALRNALAREVDERIAEDVAGALAPLSLDGDELVSAVAAALEASLLAALASQHLEADMLQVVRAKVRDEAGEVAVRACANAARSASGSTALDVRPAEPRVEAVPGLVLRVITDDGHINVEGVHPHYGVPDLALVTPADLADIGVIIKQGKHPSLRTSGDELVLEVEGAVRLQVPQNLAIALQTGDGHITVRGVDDVDAETDDGNVVIQGVGVDAALRTGDGNITVRSAGAAVAATTGSGDIVINGDVAGATLESGDGNITVRTRGGDVNAKTESGNVTVTADDCDDLDIHTEDGNIVIRGAGGAIDADTESGNITVDAHRQDEPARLTTADGNVVVRGAPRQLVANTDSGNITVNDIDPGDIVLSTACGNVVARLASGARTRVELDVDGRVNCKVRDDPQAEGRLLVTASGNVTIS